MRVVSIVFFSLFLSASAFAADLTVKVLDPQGAAVSGAQISLVEWAKDDSLILETGATSAQGIVSFSLNRQCANCSIDYCCDVSFRPGA